VEDEGEEGEGEITESSLNMHGSFLPEEHYDYNSNEKTDYPRNFTHYDVSSTDNTSNTSTTALNPYPFSFQTYDTYLRSPLRSPIRSPLRSPLHTPSQWDDEEENKGLSVY
jgi:hypothetical protein